MINLILLSLPFLVVGDHLCERSSVCSVLEENVEALLETSRELGCCSHDACVSAGESAMCSQQLAMKLQPCMQEAHEGNRTSCVREAVGMDASDVCQNVGERCEGLSSLIKHIQLATTISGCSVREGMVGSGWQGYAHSLLCNTPGSNDAKAVAIRRRMKESDKSAQWIVWVVDGGTGTAWRKSTGEKVWFPNTCGKRLLVWRRDKNLFKRSERECSSRKERQMKTLMRSAASSGGGSIAVRNRLKSSIKDFGYKYHLLSVTSGSYAKRSFVYTSCTVAVKSNGYSLYVYMR